MASRRLDLPDVLDRVEAFYGPPDPPLPRRALEWILWENAGYLIADDRRRDAYLALKRHTRLTAQGILALSREELQEIARMGGMLPDKRVSKLIAIAETVRDEFAGDLETALALPMTKAKQALKRFPGIGDPGAHRILLFTKTHCIPSVESNGLRVLTRLGMVEEAKNYSTTYRAACAFLAPYCDSGCEWMMRAYDLLRKHGQELCKNTHPRCDECLLSTDCPF